LLVRTLHKPVKIARKVHLLTNNTAWNLTKRGSNPVQREIYREKAEGRCRWEIWVPLITVTNKPARWRGEDRKPKVGLSHQLSLPTPHPSVLPAIINYIPRQRHIKSCENSRCQTMPHKQLSHFKWSPSSQKSLHVLYGPVLCRKFKLMNQDLPKN
jgi:hypothetical protein